MYSHCAVFYVCKAMWTRRADLKWASVAIETDKCLLLSPGSPTIVFYDKSTFIVHFVYLLQMYTSCSFLSFSTNLLWQEKTHKKHKKNLKYFKKQPFTGGQKSAFSTLCSLTHLWNNWMNSCFLFVKVNTVYMLYISIYFLFELNKWTSAMLYKAIWIFCYRLSSVN